MKAKELLQRVQMLNHQISNKKAEAEFYRDLAVSPTVINEGERVQQPGSKQKMADTVCIYLQFEEELTNHILELVNEKKRIIEILEMLDASEYDVLHKIYIQGYGLWELPDLTTKSYSWVSAKHSSGIKHVQELLDLRERKTKND